MTSLQLLHKNILTIGSEM